MNKAEFTKDFDFLIESFNDLTQKSIDGLAKQVDKSKDEDEGPDEPAVTSPEEVMGSKLEKLHLLTRRACVAFDKEHKHLLKERKQLDDEIKARNAQSGTAKMEAHDESAKEMNEAMLKPFEERAKTLEDLLTQFTLRVRSHVMGQENLGDKFDRAAGNLFTGLKKLDVELEKFVALEMKRKPREEKKLEVIPSKFLADYRTIYKREGFKEKELDPKLAKAMKEVEDRLKRLDTNGSFDKVSDLATISMNSLKTIMGELKGKSPVFVAALKKLIAEIETYDDHMFGLSRLR